MGTESLWVLVPGLSLCLPDRYLHPSELPFVLCECDHAMIPPFPLIRKFSSWLLSQSMMDGQGACDGDDGRVVVVMLVG